jgi:hypothetical protein
VIREDEPLELIAGHLVVAKPEGDPHAVAVTLARESLRAVFGVGWVVSGQDLVALDAESELPRA